jgi:hypothetical protein
MSVTAILSFDVYSDAPNPDAIRHGIRQRVNQHATAGRWLLSHLLHLEFPVAGAYDAFAKSLQQFHDEGAGVHFDFVSVGWIDGTRDVLVAQRPKPSRGARDAQMRERATEFEALVRATDTELSLVFNYLEVGLGFRSMVHAGAATATVIHIGAGTAAVGALDPPPGDGARRGAFDVPGEGGGRGSKRTRRKRGGKTPR